MLEGKAENGLNIFDFRHRDNAFSFSSQSPLRPGTNVIKNPFTALIYKLSYKARVFARTGLKSLSETNTPAYENP